MEKQIRKNFCGKISETLHTTTKQDTDKQDTMKETVELLRLKACILNHARRRPHVHAFSLDDGPTIFVAMLRPH
jgi:hypothetical protein